MGELQKEAKGLLNVEDNKIFRALMLVGVLCCLPGLLLVTHPYVFQAYQPVLLTILVFFAALPLFLISYGLSRSILALRKENLTVLENMRKELVEFIGKQTKKLKKQPPSQGEIAALEEMDRLKEQLEEEEEYLNESKKRIEHNRNNFLNQALFVTNAAGYTAAALLIIENKANGWLNLLGIVFVFYFFHATFAYFYLFPDAWKNFRISRSAKQFRKRMKAIQI